jgi:hypothetical protein
MAQSLRTEGIADIVYQRLPYLPKENQYISRETGEVAENNSLITRLIRYHQDIKKRPTVFRIDWQLTFADYLGFNERLQEERYPGQNTLTTNPMDADVKVIRSLKRSQRLELIDVLLSIYNPQSQDVSPAKPSPSPQPSPSQNSTPNKPPLSKPGDSQLLLP